MKTLTAIILCLASLSFTSFAGAEGGCPPGTYPANPPATNICYPFPDSPVQQEQHAPPQERPGRWETQWGAVSIGNSDRLGYGVIGAAVNKNTKAEAERTAVDDCISQGGLAAQCRKNVLRYYNQCAAVAWGDNLHVSQGAETVQEATELALQKCSNETNNCKIYYSACSLPEWVTY